MDTTWDPLDPGTVTSHQLVQRAHKLQIRNILKSYQGWFDPLSELLQNAMDAVDRRERDVADRSYAKRVSVNVDLANNRVSVSDNGVGFTEESFRRFLSPNVSDKDGTTTRGAKGVGATYLAYGFNYLQLGTKTPDYTRTMQIRGGRSWADGTDAEKPRPRVEPSKLLHEAFIGTDRGATFTLSFGGPGTRPADLSYFGAVTADQWSVLLRMKTPLGQVVIDGAPRSPIKFDLTVVDKDGRHTELHDQDACYVLPHDVIGSSMDLSKITDERVRRSERGIDPELPAKYRDLNAIYAYWDTAKIIAELAEHDMAEAFKKLASEYAVHAYAFFGYTVGLWDQFSDNTVGLRKGTRILRGGLQLASNRMPQGELVAIPLTSNIGYQNQVHAVVHFDAAEPDLGRKGFQPELEDLAKASAVAMVGILRRNRRLLKKDTGAPPRIQQEADIHNWIKGEEEREEASPLLLTNPNFFLPMREIPLTSTPVREQDVIALFHQLLAGGVIRGIRVMATDQFKQYDGLFRYRLSEPFSNHVFHATENPLGIHEDAVRNAYESRPYVLEYKANLDALIDEFEKEEKNENDVHLAVVWEAGTRWKRRYAATSLLGLDCVHLRQTHGLTHAFRDDDTGNERFAAIVLKELIEYLNDVESVQVYHRETYNESME